MLKNIQMNNYIMPLEKMNNPKSEIFDLYKYKYTNINQYLLMLNI